MEFVKQNQHLIDLYVTFLDYFQSHRIKPDNNLARRVISDFYLRILNKHPYADVKRLFIEETGKRFQSLKATPIDFDKIAKVTRIEFIRKKNKVGFSFTYATDAKKLTIIKRIANLSHRQGTDPAMDKYLFLFYFMLGFDFGHFWGIHPRIYKLILEFSESDKVVECFASPFNSNLENYFSVLYPIDKYYGSKGNFFENFMTANYETYFVNPPFELKIMQDVMAMIERKLELQKARIFFYIPQWDDIMLPWIDKIRQKKYHMKVCNLDANASITYDYVNKRPMNATFGTYFIYIDNRECDLCNNATPAMCEIMRDGAYH